MHRRARTALILVACAVLAVLSAATIASAVGAQTPNPVQSLLRAIQTDTQAIRSAVTNKNFGLREIKREIRALEARAQRLEVTAEVDEAACASVPVQCGNGVTGHSPVAASSANHNPVAIAVLVTLNGAPVSGLASAAFDFSNNILPAGGAGLTRCPAGGSGCASPANLFQDAGDGTYVLWVHPGPAGNWKTGTYYARIRVTDTAGRRGSALVEITVP
jgi:hypothetical protein